MNIGGQRLRQFGMLGWFGAALVLFSVPVEAQPFAFDPSEMPGFKVLTAEDGAMKAEDQVVIIYEGAITSPMAENLRVIWNEIATKDRFKRVVFRLNSPGGTDIHGRQVIAILAEMRDRLTLTTLVAENDLCASMCVALFVQGEKRYASPASSWMFHGASSAMSNIPSLSMTDAYFDLLEERAIDRHFIDSLFEKEYVTSPGAYWVSGSELAQDSNVITRLLPNWIPADPIPGPSMGMMAPSRMQASQPCRVSRSRYRP